MIKQYTAEDILELIGHRKLHLDLGTTIDAARSNICRPREQLNNKTIEELNNTSRVTCGDVESNKSGLSQPLSKTPDNCFSGMDMDPRELSSSKFTGIIAQHCRTAKGIKIAITLQNEAGAQLGKKLLVTAELKRYDRLREVTKREHDSDEFNAFLDHTKAELYAERDHSKCLGKIHARGKRSSWVKDALVIGVLDQEVITNIIIYIEGNFYTIELNGELTDNQRAIYHSTGSYGVVRQLNRVAPRITELEWTDC